MKREAVIFGGLGLVLVAMAALVAQKEWVVAHGTPVLLKLAPKDPRSLIQGDYMVLDYEISQGWREGRATPQEDGNVVLRLDEHGVGSFVRYETPDAPPGPGELRLRYRVRSSRMRLGAEAFYFQEGHADRYDHAVYGELRVTGNGTSVLVGLRGADLQRLGDAVR